MQTSDQIAEMLAGYGVTHFFFVPVVLPETVKREAVAEGKVDPCLSHTYAFDDIPECHQLMLENKHPYGNMAVMVNARQPGQGAKK